MKREINIEKVYEYMRRHIPFGEVSREDTFNFIESFLQAQCNCVQVYQIQPINNFFGVIGFVTYNDIANVDAENIWHLTNWSCWSKEEEPKAVKCDGLTYHPNKNDQGYTNHDICFYDGEKWMCADMCGWSSFDTLDDAFEHLKQTNKK